MKIIYDSQIFSFQEYGGISRYFIKLYNYLNKIDNVETDIIVKYSNNKLLQQNISVNPFFPKNRFKGRNEIIKWLNRKHFVKNIPTQNSESIFHPTYYNPYFINRINLPYVLTIYDMAHELFPTMFHTLDFSAKHKKISALNASKIIAISENTKKDIVNILNIPESKIEVIYLASDLDKTKSTKPEKELPNKYLLYVGARNTYKNFSFLLQALKEIIKEEKDLCVVCAGGGNFNQKELLEITQNGLSNHLIQINVNDSELSYLYKNAIALVYPSIYEGFGIPIVEAFQLGCPVILSEIGSLKEVGENATIFFNPYNLDSLIQSLFSVLKNPNSLQQLKTKGYERAKIFSWDITVKKTLEVYTSITNPPH